MKAAPVDTPTASRSLRILAVTELGSNWGHLLRLLPVIQALHSRGHQVVLAVPDVAQARQALNGVAIDIEPCPSARRVGPQPPVVYYAEMLHQCVFGDGPTLERALFRWDELLARRRPHVLLTEFAPTALLVAHLHRLPSVQVATGWEAPPMAGPLPVVRDWDVNDSTAVRSLEEDMLSRLNGLCERRSVPALPSVSALYGVGCQLLATWPETDHFGPRSGAQYIGPIYANDHGESVEWQNDSSVVGLPRIFLYLAPDRRNVAIVDALRRAGMNVIAILPKITPQAIARIASTKFQVREHPVRVDSVLAGADLVISNGGHGLTAASLLAGVRVLAMPQTLEQAKGIRRLAENGAVRSMMEGGGPERCAQLVHEMLADDRARRAAREIERKYAGSDQKQTLELVVRSIEASQDGRQHQFIVDAGRHP